MDAKLYPLAFYAMAISNYCECALDDRYLSNIFHKLDEVKQSLLIEMGEKISTLENKAGEKIYTLENKVDRLLNAMQGCHRYNDTRGKLLFEGKENKYKLSRRRHKKKTKLGAYFVIANSYVTKGIFHHYHLDESTFILGASGVILISFHFSWDATFYGVTY